MSFKWTALLFFGLLFGCSSIGPSVLMLDRYHYNIAFDASRNRELLLNMVRLRYDHTPMMLSVGNISGSTTFGRQGQFGLFPNFKNQLGLLGIIQLNDNPIISYTPVDDFEFNTRFLSKFTLKQIMRLIETSWSISRVFRMLLQQVGTAVNASNSARPTSHHVPKYKVYLNMVSVLRQLQLDDALDISYQANEPQNEENLIIHINHNHHLTAKERDTFKKAGIILEQDTIILSNTVGPHKTPVVTRSSLGVLNYLSKGVIVPPEDIRNHQVTITRYKNGRLFDWQQVLNGIMRIESSLQKPKDTSVEIYYLNRWYYIKNTDDNSKKTFILLTNIVGFISPTPINSPVGLTRNV